MPGKRDYRYYKNVDQSRLLNIALDYWRGQKFELRQTHQNVYQGTIKKRLEGYYLNLTLSIGENGGQTYLDVSMVSSLTSWGEVDRATDYGAFGIAEGFLLENVDDHLTEKEISRLVDNLWKHVDRNLSQ